MREKAISLMPKDVRARIAADQRGAITSGYNNGKHPVSLPHFYVNDYPEIQRVYGEKPTKLIVMFPADDLRDFIIAEHNLYLKSKATGKGIKFRYCDGETCAFNCDMTIANIKYSAGEVKPCVCKAHNLEKDAACKSYFHFKAWIVDPNTRLIISHIAYRFETRSPNSRDNILGELKNILLLTSPNGEATAEDDFITSGRLIGLYFMLYVKMVEQHGKQVKKFPIWHLQAIGDKNCLLECAEQAQLPITKAVLTLTPGDIQAAEMKMLSDGTSVVHVEDDEEPVKEAIILETQTEMPFKGDSQVFPGKSSALPSLNDLPKKRQELLSRFADFQSSYSGNLKNKVILTLHKNGWNGDMESLSDEEIQTFLEKVK